MIKIIITFNFIKHYKFNQGLNKFFVPINIVNFDFSP